jgi:hypothetical protein
MVAKEMGNQEKKVKQESLFLNFIQPKPSRTKVLFFCHAQTHVYPVTLIYVIPSTVLSAKLSWPHPCKHLQTLWLQKKTKKQR